MDIVLENNSDQVNGRNFPGQSRSVCGQGIGVESRVVPRLRGRSFPTPSTPTYQTSKAEGWEDPTTISFPSGFPFSLLKNWIGHDKDQERSTSPGSRTTHTYAVRKEHRVLSVYINNLLDIDSDTIFLVFHNQNK